MTCRAVIGCFFGRNLKKKCVEFPLIFFSGVAEVSGGSPLTPPGEKKKVCFDAIIVCPSKTPKIVMVLYTTLILVGCAVCIEIGLATRTRENH